MEISAAQDSRVTGQAACPLPPIPGNQVPIAGNERKPSSRIRQHSLPFCKGSFSFPEALENDQEYPSVLLGCFFFGGLGKSRGQSGAKNLSGEDMIGVRQNSTPSLNSHTSP